MKKIKSGVTGFFLLSLICMAPVVAEEPVETAEPVEVAADQPTSAEAPAITDYGHS